MLASDMFVFAAGVYSRRSRLPAEEFASVYRYTADVYLYTCV